MNKKTLLKYFIYFISLIFILPSSSLSLTSKSDPKAMYNAGVDVYIYAYPLVLMDLTKKVMTNVSSAGTNGNAPINQFSHANQLATPENKDVVLPNSDTLYSIAWLDLSAEPLILSVPNTNGRYYLLPLLDAWTEVFASPGKRTTGTEAGNFIIVGPNWHGSLPPNMPVITAATNTVWITGRTLVYSPDDVANANQIQQGYTLTPLSKWGTNYTPPDNLPIDPTIDTVTPPNVQMNKMDAATFYQAVADILKTNPPHAEDTDILEQLKIIGIVPGEDFDIHTLSAADLHELTLAAKDALAEIIAYIPKSGTTTNSWKKASIIGHYGTNYLDRASIAYIGLGANAPEDAIYQMAFTDSSKAALSGTSRYVIHFSQHEIPPVNGFWSVSLYGMDGFSVPNAMNRYSLGDRSNMHFNSDGSLDIYVQHDAPDKDKTSNWLPAPEGNFDLLMRLYWPKTRSYLGVWTPPGINTIK